MGALYKIVNCLSGVFGLSVARVLPQDYNVKDISPIECFPSDALRRDVLSRFQNEFELSENSKYSQSEISEVGKKYFWHYPLSLGNCFFDSDFEHFVGKRGRHYLRYKHFFPTIVNLAGGSLKGNTILDCGCNCGFWSIQSILNGADSITAFDASELNIEQALFLEDVTGIKGINYKVADLDNFTEKITGLYDISLFLGLLYHVNRPIDILRALRNVTRKFAVVDTTISPLGGSALYVEKDFAHEQNKCNNLCFLPTAQAVYDLLIFAGFKDVKFIPNFDSELSDDYLTGERMTFIAWV